MGRYPFGHSAKPLIVAGHGIRISGAQKELFRVLEQGYPVVTTFNGFDLVPNDHPSFVGRIGSLGDYAGNYALRNCDVVYLIGTRNNIRQTSYTPESFAPQAKKVVVNIDSPCKKDAKVFLRFLAGIHQKIDPTWLDHLTDYAIKNSIIKDGPYKFMYDFTKELPEGAIVVCGNGTACVCMFQAGIVKKNQRIFWNSGCAAMGYDLPAAIGAYYASGKEVYCITGEGSIQMNIQELQTIRHYNLPIKIIVLNNGGYRSIQMTQENYFEGDFIGCSPESGVSFPDLSEVTTAYNISYFEDWRCVIKSKGPCLCEVEIGNDYVFKPKWTRTL